jgi:hypothetical protein
MNAEQSADKVPSSSTVEAAEANSLNSSGTAPSIDLSHLRLSQNFQAALGVTKRLTTVPVRRAGPQDFFRVHPSPEYALQTMLLEFKDDGEVYLVDPSLWRDLAGELVPKILYLTVSRQNVVRLWPIRLPDEEGKLDDWNRSALEAAEIGKTNWIRLRANRSLGAYEVFEAHGEIPAPEWPDLTLQQIVEIAFKGKFITSWDHPALRRLRGEG